MGHRRLLLTKWLIKVSSFVVWCNLVDVKYKQGFLECKHAALNFWKAVLLLALGFSVDPAGVGPTEPVFSRLHCSFLFDLFHRWQNDLFGSEEVVLGIWLDCSYLAVLPLLFWFSLPDSGCVVLPYSVLGEFFKLLQYLRSVTQFLAVISTFHGMQGLSVLLQQPWRGNL